MSATEQIYEALFDDEALARLPHLVAEAANARSGLMQWRHLDGGWQIFAMDHFSPEVVERLPDYLTICPWTTLGLKFPNRFLRLDDYVSTEVFRKTRVYNDLVRDAGDDTMHCMGETFTSPWGSGTLSAHRSASAGAFVPDDERRMSALLGHFKNVLWVRGELAASRHATDLARDALDSLAVATITVRADRRILSANTTAEEVLRRADGLISRDGVLTATTATAAVRIAQAVERAAARGEPAATSIFVGRGLEQDDYLVTATPLSGQRRTPAALLLFRDPEFPDGSLAQRLHVLYGLTSAEASIAVDLAKGRSTADLVGLRGVSFNTVRAQLKAVAGKMGVSRQSEIAALVASLPRVRSHIHSDRA